VVGLVGVKVVKKASCIIAIVVGLLSGSGRASNDYVVDSYKYIYGVAKALKVDTVLAADLANIKSGATSKLSTVMEKIYSTMAAKVELGDKDESFKGTYHINSIITSEESFTLDDSLASFKNYFSGLATTGQGILIAKYIYENISCSGVEIENVPLYEILVNIFSGCTGTDLFVRYRAEFLGLLDCLCYACSPKVTTSGQSREEKLTLSEMLIARPVVGGLLTQIHEKICEKINTTLGISSSSSASTIKYTKENVFADFLTAVYCGALETSSDFNSVLQKAIGTSGDCEAAASRLSNVAARIFVSS
jgi:hypothetical protein